MSEAAVTQPEAPALTPPRIAALGAVVLLALAAGYRAWADIAAIAWQDPEQSQVLLALPAFVTLLCFHKSQILKAPIQASAYALIAVAMGAAMSWYGYMHAVQSVWHLGAVVMVVGAAWSVLGNRFMLAILPAAIALGALVPVPNMLRQDIALPLQQMTAGGGEFVLTALGFDVQRTGLTLLYQDKPVTIEEACNGMRMVFALLLVCYAFVMSANLNTFARLMLIAASPLLAVLCNIIRVVPTVVIYGELGDGPGDVFHDLSGWAMIALAAFMLLGLVRLLAWAEVPIYAQALVPKRVLPYREPQRRLPAWAGPASVCVLLLAMAVHSLTLPGASDAHAYHRAVAEAASDTSIKVAGLNAVPIELPEGSLKMLRANTARAVAYDNQLDATSAQFLLIQSKDARDLSGHYPPRCYPNVYGYIETDRQPKRWVVGDTVYSGTEYTFAESNRPEATQWVVMHFFALPNGETTGRLPDMRRAAADYLRRHQGAAQIQLLCNKAQTTAEQRDAMFRQVLAAHEQLLTTILAGPNP